jgi:phosphatidylethanolamine/phosphatidyl-N-methylethanolamine N-methyltransferase
MSKQRDFFENDYERMFYSGGLSGWLTHFIHRALERNFSLNSFFPRTLEVGGGQGRHVKYVRHTFEEYCLLDMRELPLVSYADDLRVKGRLHFVTGKAEKLPFHAESYDRIIMMCLLHHVEDVEQSLGEARRVCKPGGQISIYLPCDPGIIYRFIRKLTLLTNSHSHTIDYELVNAREHRGHIFAIHRLIQEVYKLDTVSESRWPFSLFPLDFNIFSVIHVAKSLTK